jgi:hypothetical protein
MITEEAPTDIDGILLALRALQLLSLLLLDLLGTGVTGVYGGDDGQVETRLRGCSRASDPLPQVVYLLRRRCIVVLQIYEYVC